MLSLSYGNDFHSHANKTHFHKNGCACCLILKVRVFGTQKWPIVVWVFHCYQSFLVSLSHYAWNDHINRLSTKTNHISLRCICLCLVTRQMFSSTSLTKRGRLLTNSLTCFICFTPSLIVKGLPMLDFSCETCVCQIFWLIWDWISVLS